MLEMLKRSLSRLFTKEIQTFTYFIPAPPGRQIGYQEKEFDRITCELIEAGWSISEIKTQSLNTSETSGLWVILLLRGPKGMSKISIDPFRSNSEAEFKIDDHKMSISDRIEGLTIEK